MSEKTYTERDMIRAKREAFSAALRLGLRHESCGEPACIQAREAIERKARERYPIPVTTRPRVVTNNGTSWRIADQRLQYLAGWYNQAKWETLLHLGDPGFEVVIGSLFNQPTEIVPDEDP